MFTQTYTYEENKLWKLNLELQEIQLQIYLKKLKFWITKITNKFENKIMNDQKLQLLRKIMVTVFTRIRLPTNLKNPEFTKLRINLEKKNWKRKKISIKIT